MLEIRLGSIDYMIIGIYFVFVLGIGFWLKVVSEIFRTFYRMAEWYCSRTKQNNCLIMVGVSKRLNHNNFC